MGMSNEMLETMIGAALQHAAGKPMTLETRAAFVLDGLERARETLREACEKVGDGDGADELIDVRHALCEAIELLRGDV